jgi:hypothetical protein
VILSFKGLNAQSLLQIAPTQAGVVAQTVIPALRRLRQEDWMLAASLGYIVRPVSKQTHEKAKFISFIICLI